MTEEDKNPIQWLSDENMLPSLLDPAADRKLDNIRQILETIRKETVPTGDHPDPRAVDDCWNEVFEQIDAMMA